MSSMKIIAGPKSEKLTQKIANQLNLKSLKLNYKFFTDGETYLQIEGDPVEEDILVVQTTYPEQEKRLLETMMISKTLKEMGAAKVIAIIPYLCYARADRRRIEGEVISHNIVLDLLSKSGVDSLVTINVHNPEAFHNTSEDLEKYNLNVLPAIKEFFQEKISNEWVIVGPDKGSEKDVSNLARELSISHFILEKYRDPKTHEIQIKMDKNQDRSKKMILFDDVITSGGTALKACEMLLNDNSSELIFIVIHALADSKVFEKMKKIGVNKILSTNTIDREDIEQIDISYRISKFIEEKFQ